MCFTLAFEFGDRNVVDLAQRSVDLDPCGFAQRQTHLLSAMAATAYRDPRPTDTLSSEDDGKSPGASVAPNTKYPGIPKNGTTDHGHSDSAHSHDVNESGGSYDDPYEFDSYSDEFEYDEEDEDDIGNIMPPFVRILPNHPLHLLPRALWYHPDDFVPRPDPRRGYVHDWGIDEDENPNETKGKSMTEMMKEMMLKDSYQEANLETPEVQFAEALARKKVEKLKRQLPESSVFFKRDFVLKITLTGERERDVDLAKPLWRRVRVSGGISLSAFQDKVIGPVMGWARNFHAYQFLDRTDGSIFGPKNSRAIDIQHLGTTGYYMNDDTLVRLGELLQKPGDVIGYMYDLGDGWSHVIQVEVVIPEESSTGATELLGGAVSCPPEDSKGLGKGLQDIGPEEFNKVIQLALRAESGLKKAQQNLEKIKKQTAMAKNYSGEDGRAALKLYPLGFDLEAARKRLKDAISTKHSERSNPEIATYRMADGARITGKLRDLYDDEPKTVPVERRDKKKVALCVKCGSPNNLKGCSRCKLVFYCSQVCQKADWKEGHKEICVPVGQKD